LLDVAHEVKALSPILEIQPFSFAIDLAALASRREYLNLEKWLQDRIDEHQVDFIRACVAYLKEKKRLANKVESSQRIDRATSAITLSAETIGIFIGCLQANASLMPPELAEEFEQQQQMQAAPPKAMMAQPTPNAPAPEKQEFPPEIEGPANVYFQVPTVFCCCWSL